MLSSSLRVSLLGISKVSSTERMEPRERVRTRYRVLGQDNVMDVDIVRGVVMVWHGACCSQLCP